MEHNFLRNPTEETICNAAGQMCFQMNFGFFVNFYPSFIILLEGTDVMITEPGIFNNSTYEKKNGMKKKELIGSESKLTYQSV